jgi:hypothetical protein
MTLAVDSVLGSSVEVSGEEAAFRLKRPIDDRDPYDGENGTKTDDGNEGRAEVLRTNCRPWRLRTTEFGIRRPKASIAPTSLSAHQSIEVTPDGEGKGKKRLETLGRVSRAKEDFTNDPRDGHWRWNFGRSKWDSV